MIPWLSLAAQITHSVFKIFFSYTDDLFIFYLSNKQMYFLKYRTFFRIKIRVIYCPTNGEISLPQHQEDSIITINRNNSKKKTNTRIQRLEIE